MPNFAVISSNKVINVIVAESKEVAEAITTQRCEEITEAFPVKLNWEYDSQTNEWYEPEELF